MQIMDERSESAEDAAFRAEARAWLEEHAPAHATPDPGNRAALGSAAWREQAMAWQAVLVGGGWAAITWPKAYGGRDGTAKQQKIFNAELRHFDVPRGLDASIAMGMVAPTILAHGTEAQKARFLLPLLLGEEQWCQLFSEPGAGSDLAGITCRAERDGDEWIVNGQKVWTSSAHESEFGILLARTDADQPKHRGISYFLIEMDQPGVDIRPLRQMTGDAEFNEVFLTDARVPHDMLVGELNGGWAVAMTTLANERVLMGGLSSGFGGGRNPLVELAHAHGAAGDPVVRRQVTDMYIRGEVLRYLGLRLQGAAQRGRPPGPESSVMKLMMGENAKRTSGVALAIQGSAGALVGEDAPSNGSWQHNFLRAPSVRIAGGSDQIQRNVIGERVLGLPAEPRVDKDVPFRDVLKNPT